MVRALLAIFVWIGLALPMVAQTSTVSPDDLSLAVTLETLPETPLRQEMILVTIHGVYKRHITLERLEQPDLAGFNWMQLGHDQWFESMVDGRPVKNLRRRMAIFPHESGRLEIAPFLHHLTLLDEDNKWFEHTIASNAITLEVAAEPQVDGWWFPARKLTVSDDWSNAPDQLAPGEGVLRVVRISALGASPDMIPPMPELTSPSALIFAHPEKRLVNLTPYGPETIAFWRWTVTPTNGHSAILEPIEFTYFDTTARLMRNVVITPQRVAFGDVTDSGRPTASLPPPSATLRPLLLASAGGLAFVAGALLLLSGQVISIHPFREMLSRQQLLWRFHRAGRTADMATLRRSTHALDQLYLPSDDRRALLAEMDKSLFGRGPDTWESTTFCRRFRRSLTKPLARADHNFL